MLMSFEVQGPRSKVQSQEGSSRFQVPGSKARRAACCVLRDELRRQLEARNQKLETVCSLVMDRGQERCAPERQDEEGEGRDHADGEAAAGLGEAPARDQERQID